MIYCIFSAGGRRLITPPRSPKRRSPNRPCWTIFASRSTRIPPPAAASINHRVGTAERALRLAFPRAARLFAPGFQNWYWRQSRLGYGRPRPALTQLRVKTPKRMIVPLSVDEVARFWSSFRTSRDLAIVGLMLLHGLRSCEVLALNREDLQFPDSQIRVRGQGQQDPLAAAGSRIREAARSLSAAGTASALWPSFIRLSQRPGPRPSDDSRRSTFPVSSSPSNHRRDQSQPPPVSALCNIPDYASSGRVSRFLQGFGPE